jgi:hypothetical protein
MKGYISAKREQVKFRCCEKTRKDEGAYCPIGAGVTYSPSTELKDEATGYGCDTATSVHGEMLQEKT